MAIPVVMPAAKLFAAGSSSRHALGFIWLPRRHLLTHHPPAFSNRLGERSSTDCAHTQHLASTLPSNFRLPEWESAVSSLPYLLPSPNCVRAPGALCPAHHLTSPTRSHHSLLLCSADTTATRHYAHIPSRIVAVRRTTFLFEFCIFVHRTVERGGVLRVCKQIRQLSTKTAKLATPPNNVTRASIATRNARSCAGSKG